MRYIKNLTRDIGHLGSEIYQSARRNKMVYGLSAGMLLLPAVVRCTKTPIEHELKTEAEMSAYFEKTLGNDVSRVDKNLRMTTAVPPVETGWVTINVDYKVNGQDDTYVELVSVDDGLNENQNTAIELADAYGLKPDVKRIYPGTASEIDDQLIADGLR